MKTDQLTFCILAGGLLISTSLLTTVFSSSISKRNETHVSGDKFLPPCPDNYTGFIRNEEDCHSFYICNHGLPTLTPCPSDLCFDIRYGKCEHCESVPGCESTSASPTTSTTTTKATTTSTTTTITTTLPTTIKTTTTSPTTISTTTVTTTTPSTTPSPPELVCPDVPFILLEYPRNCTLFYQCEHGKYINTHSCKKPGEWFQNGIGCWSAESGKVCNR